MGASTTAMQHCIDRDYQMPALGLLDILVGEPYAIELSAPESASQEMWAHVVQVCSVGVCIMLMQIMRTA